MTDFGAAGPIMYILGPLAVVVSIAGIITFPIWFPIVMVCKGVKVVYNGICNLFKKKSNTNTNTKQ